ncbi:MAG TPA: sn-glycerol-3-phosphate ABC transporter ATP-binding protein UgpC [Bacillota bacterium]|nr:sn-glycerol-3-phosphate ABC transporter ATP-binding protein UgpC [Bacillota bacterium]
MSTVTLKGVSKVYGQDVVAVSDFNLEIHDKEFVVLVGPSGCGKSTVLRMIAGLEDITEGEIYIGDCLVNHVAPKNRDIAMVFQNYALYPHMTVYENMAFSLKLRKMKKKEVASTVLQAADILDITEYLERKPKALSGGQKQRVAIGRAIVRKPKVFLMDEPLSNLDAKLRTQMRAEIIKLRQRIDTTFVYVTHDQIEAMTLGDRIVIIKDGVIQQTGTPGEVFFHPRNLFVAGFIGTPPMNFFDGGLAKEGERYKLRVEGASICLSEEKQRALSRAGCGESAVMAGVRPEYIVIAEEGKQEGVLSGTLIFSEMMGSSVHLHVKVNDKELVVVRPTDDPSVSGASIPSAGSVCRLSFSGDSCHLFDKETGENLI